MKTFLLSFFSLLLISGTTSFAQNVTPKVTWEETALWNPKKLALGGMVVIDENRYVMVRGKGKPMSKLKLELYDKRNLSKVIQKEITLGKGIKLWEFRELTLVGEELYLFSSFYEKDKKKRNLHAHRISLTDLSLDSPKTIAFAYTKKESKHIGISVSEDRSKLLIYSVDDYLSHDPFKVKLAIFDSQLHPIKEQKYILPYENKQYKIVRSLLDNKGNIYLIGDFAAGKSIKKHQGSVLILNTKDEIKEHFFGVERKYIKDLVYKIDKQNNLVAAGLFTDISRVTDFSPRMEGVFFFNFNKSLDRLHQRIVYFESNEFTTNNKAISKKGRFDTNLLLKDIFIKEDNSLLLALEQFEIDAIDPISSNPNYRLSGLLNHNSRMYAKNLVLVNIQALKINWTSIIRRKELITDLPEQSISFASVQSGNDMYFVFNDTKKNYEAKEKVKKIFTYHQSKEEEHTLVIKKLDKNGKWKTYLPKIKGKNAIAIRPELSKQINKHELFLYSDLGNHFRIGQLKL